jgi:hypothetical protein
MNVPTLKTGVNTVMTTATLRRVVRDPRSGEVHLPSEQVAIVRVMRNLDRTLVKVAWQAGGDCVVFPEDLKEPIWACERAINRIRARAGIHQT